MFHLFNLQRKRKQNTNKNGAGRSMIEMLGVLAVIGVLSIIALAGFQYAMNKHRANETIHDVMLRATNVPMIDENYVLRPDGYEWLFAGLPQKGRKGTYYDMTTVVSDLPEYIFKVDIPNVPKKVCRQILAMNPTDIDAIYVEGDKLTDSEACPNELNAMAFYFDEDWSNNKNPGGSDPDNPDPNCPTAPVCGECQIKLFDAKGCHTGCQDTTCCPAPECKAGWIFNEETCTCLPNECVTPPVCGACERVNLTTCSCEAVPGCTCPEFTECSSCQIQTVDDNNCPVCISKECSVSCEAPLVGAGYDECGCPSRCEKACESTCPDGCCENGVCSSECALDRCCDEEGNCDPSCACLSCEEAFNSSKCLCTNEGCNEGECVTSCQTDENGCTLGFSCSCEIPPPGGCELGQITCFGESSADQWCCDATETCGETTGECIQCPDPEYPLFCDGICCPEGSTCENGVCCEGGVCCSGDEKLIKSSENTDTGEVQYQCCKGDAYLMYEDGAQKYYSCCQGTVFTNYRGEKTCCWDSDEIDPMQGYYVTKGKLVDVFENKKGKVGQTCCTYYTQSEEWTEEGSTMKDVFYNPVGAIVGDYGYAKCCNGGIYDDNGETYGCCNDPEKPQGTWWLGTTKSVSCCAVGETAANNYSQYQNNGCCTDGRVALEGKPDGWGTVQSYCCYPGEGVFDNAEVRHFQDRTNGCCPVGMEVYYHREVHHNWDPDALAYYTITQDDTLTTMSNCCIPGTTYNQCCQPDSPNQKYNSLGDFISCCPDGQTAYCEVFDKDGKCVHYLCSSTPCRPYCERYDHYTGKCVVGGCQTDMDCTFAVVNNRTGCCPSGTTPYCSGLKWMDNGSGGVTPGDCYGDILCCEGTVYRNTSWSEDQQFCCPTGSFVYSGLSTNKFNEDGSCDMSVAVMKNICCPDDSEPGWRQGTGGCGPHC